MTICRLVCLVCIIFFHQDAKLGLDELQAQCQAGQLVLLPGDGLSSQILKTLRQELSDPYRQGSGQGAPWEAPWPTDGVGAKAYGPSLVTGWRQQEGVEVILPDGSKRATVTALELDGDSRLLFPVSAHLALDDISGCLLSAEAARMLFGGYRVTGQAVRIGGEERTVRGILFLDGSFAVYEAQKDKAPYFSGLALGSWEAQGTAWKAQEKGLQARYVPEGLALEEESLLFTAGLAAWQPQNLSLLLPSRWSDLSHWQRLRKRFQDTRQTYSRALAFLPVRHRIRLFFRILRNGLAATLLLLGQALFLFMDGTWHRAEKGRQYIRPGALPPEQS